MSWQVIREAPIKLGIPAVTGRSGHGCNLLTAAAWLAAMCLLAVAMASAGTRYIENPEPLLLASDAEVSPEKLLTRAVMLSIKSCIAISMLIVVVVRIR